MKQEERMDEAIENGLDYAIARKDTFWLLLFIGERQRWLIREMITPR